MQNGAKMAVRIIAGILVLALVAGLVVMAVSAAEDNTFAANENYWQLTANVSDITVDHDMVLDLNGFDATEVTVNEGVTLQLVDSANDQYDAKKCGSFSGTILGTVAQVTAYNDKDYLVIAENGVYSAHRFYAGINNISLAPQVAALGYKAYFYADEKIAPMVESYGYTLRVNDLKAKTYVKSGNIADSELTLRVKNILNEENAELSQLGAAATIYGMATICFNVNGQAVTVNGAEHATTLKEAVEAVNIALGNDRASYTQSQVDSVKAMCNKFAVYMDAWQVGHILAVEKFAPQNAELTYGETVTLGELFAVLETEYAVGNVTVTVNGEAITLAENWADTVLTLNVGAYEIVITDDNYAIPATATVTVIHADPEVPAVGTLTATYGDDLSSVNLPEGFTWISTGSVGNAGENIFIAKYDNGDANYNTVEVEVVVSVSKADPEVPAVGTLTATYGDNLSSVNLPEGFTWISTGSVGNAGENTFTAKYDNGDANYNTVEVEVVVSVSKADPEVPAVGILTATYGDNLSSVNLPEGFTWISTGSVGNAGENTFTAKYDNGDANYNTVEVEVVVSVSKADPEVPAVGELTATEGDALSSITLPAGFAWVDGNETVTLEKSEYAATYSNNDPNYNTVNVNIPVLVSPAAPAIQIERKMPEAEFIYRLGNMNAVSINSLIKNSDDSAIDLSKLSVSVAAQNGHVVSGAYDAAEGKLTFTGTGLVEITFTGDANSVSLTFEIVNAKNATTAASATANNVVLLNDCGFSSASVGNGYTLFGNGFTMTATSESYADTLGSWFLRLDNGTLDNVRIVVPFFAYSFLYQGQAKNESAVATTVNANYYNMRSAVYMTGNSKILNSYISGGRAAVYAPSGNPVFENTTIYGGSAANIHVGSVQSVTMRDMTMVQMPIEGTVNGKNPRTTMGFGVLIECDGEGNSAPLTLEGELNQFAWFCEDYKTYVPTEASDVLTAVLSKSDFIHKITIGNKSDNWMNLGIAYAYLEGQVVPKTPSITDNRIDKAAKPYSGTTVEALIRAYVYSYDNSKRGSGETEQIPEENVVTDNGVTAPVIAFNDQGTGKTFETKFDTTNGWMSTLTVDLDTTGDYTFQFANLVASKYGKNLTYTVKDAAGNAVGQTVALTDSGVHEYTLTITDNADCNGEAIHTYVFVLTATKTSIAVPEKVAEPGGAALLVVKSKNSDWSCAIPALEGTQIKYYNKTNKQYETLSLSSLTPSSTGKQNETNNYWNYSDPNGNFTLKVTCGVIHEGKSVYGMPVVVNNSGNKMYFTIANANGFVSTSTTSRAVTISYEFTDGNGQALTFSKTWQFNYADYKNGKQYSYDSFVNGTLKEAGSGTCVTGDTLVTLADGTQVRVDSLTGAEQLLVWNHTTASYDIAPVAYIVNHDEQIGEHVVTVLHFADGSRIKIVGEHVFFDADRNQYVAITERNAQNFVGHDFAVSSDDGLVTAELVKVEKTVEKTGLYEVVTYKTITCFTNGILSASAYLDPIMNIFDIDPETMGYNIENMMRDIDTYGLYTYADFADLIDEKAFDLYNAAYLKIAVGKGYITWDDILDLIDIYFDVEVKPLN